MHEVAAEEAFKPGAWIGVLGRMNQLNEEFLGVVDLGSYSPLPKLNEELRALEKSFADNHSQMIHVRNNRGEKGP